MTGMYISSYVNFMRINIINFWYVMIILVMISKCL